jgi:hypothetical protein
MLYVVAIGRSWPFISHMVLLRNFAVCLFIAFFGPLSRGELTVRDGVLLREGREYAGVGMNYYDAFMLVLEDHPGAVEKYRGGFAFLAEAGIPFVRFAACGFYPSEWQIYLERPDEYFAKLDALVKEAESRGVGLIPVLFWSFFALPDTVGEPVSAWGDGSSRTRELMRRYTREVLERYKGSSAIWAWEFGNEYINDADLPADVKSTPWIVPERGTPDRRDPADRLKSAAVRDAYKDFARTVRELDPDRPIMTGDTAPRVSAWHLARNLGWKRDSSSQWVEALLAANPDPVDTLSVHFYHPRRDGVGYGGYGVEGQDLRANLALAMEASREAGKPLWLGEFGPGIGEDDEKERRRQVGEFLDLIVDLRIPLSAYWVYDSPNRELKVWNAVPGGANGFVFEMIAEANQRLQDASSK